MEWGVGGHSRSHQSDERGGGVGALSIKSPERNWEIRGEFIDMCHGQNLGHRGIMRSMKGGDSKIARGLRFRRSDFKKAFSELRPQDSVPSDIPPTCLFKISPMPIGASSENVQTWLDGLSWQAKPMRFVGIYCVALRCIAIGLNVRNVGWTSYLSQMPWSQAHSESGCHRRQYW